MADATDFVSLFSPRGLDASTEWMREDVRFRSPFTDYDGIADVTHLFGLIQQVLTRIEVTQKASDDPWSIVVLAAVAEDHDVEGTLVITRDEAGRLADAMLTLRPFEGLQAAMAAMRARLDIAPLPSELAS